MNLGIVGRGSLAHPLEIAVDLSRLADIFQAAFTLLFDLVDVPLQLGDHLPHLLLIGLLLSQLVLQHSLALDQLFAILLQIANLAPELRVLAHDLI